MPVRADELVLPKPGTLLRLSPEFTPPMLKGIKVHPEAPFRFDFILDKGDSALDGEGLKDESNKLIKYFLASLTVPEKDLWVNLSPYEKDRIIPESFGTTEMGRNLLAEDYILKQITASLIYPEDETGKKFWKRVYEEAGKKFGTTEVPVNTFNKVWIVPDKAVVYENAASGTAYVVEGTLKVMLEEDYLALKKNTDAAPGKAANKIGSQIVREIVIPQLTKEINTSRNFAQLRQVYSSLILAVWYKKKIRDSILAQVYADKNKTAGIGHDDPEAIGSIYEQYLQAFKKGVYNYIKEEQDPITRQVIPRKYFSGGAELIHVDPVFRDLAQLAVDHPDVMAVSPRVSRVTVDVRPQQDAAMAATVTWEQMQEQGYSIRIDPQQKKKLEKKGARIVKVELMLNGKKMSGDEFEISLMIFDTRKVVYFGNLFPDFNKEGAGQYPGRGRALRNEILRELELQGYRYISDATPEARKSLIRAQWPGAEYVDPDDRTGKALYNKSHPNFVRFVRELKLSAFDQADIVLTSLISSANFFAVIPNNVGADETGEFKEYVGTLIDDLLRIKEEVAALKDGEEEGPAAKQAFDSITKVVDRINEESVRSKNPFLKKMLMTIIQRYYFDDRGNKIRSYPDLPNVLNAIFVNIGKDADRVKTLLGQEEGQLGWFISLLENFRAVDVSTLREKRVQGPEVIFDIAPLLPQADSAMLAQTDVAQDAGARNMQEDRYLSEPVDVPEVPNGRGQLLAVMDGHSRNGDSGQEIVDQVKNALVESFKKNLVEAKGYAEHALRMTVSNMAALTSERISGTTLSMVYVSREDQKAYYAIVGDSPVFFVKKDGSMFMPPTHNLEDFDNNPEVKRIQGLFLRKEEGMIEQAGIFIENGRKSIKVPRALGNRDFGRIISKLPYVGSIELGDVRTVGLATDGIIFNNDSREAVSWVAGQVFNGNNAKTILEHKKEKNNDDNITLMLLPLSEPGRDDAAMAAGIQWSEAAKAALRPVLDKVFMEMNDSPDPSVPRAFWFNQNIIFPFDDQMGGIKMVSLLKEVLKGLGAEGLTQAGITEQEADSMAEFLVSKGLIGLDESGVLKSSFQGLFALNGALDKNGIRSGEQLHPSPVSGRGHLNLKQENILKKVLFPLGLPSPRSEEELKRQQEEIARMWYEYILKYYQRTSAVYQILTRVFLEIANKVEESRTQVTALDKSGDFLLNDLRQGYYLHPQKGFLFEHAGAEEDALEIDSRLDLPGLRSLFGKDPVKIFEVFRWSLEKNAPIGFKILEAMKQSAKRIDQDQRQRIARIFEEILNAKGDVSDILVQMQEAGVLAWVMPSLAELDNHFPGGPHRFTTTRHTLYLLYVLEHVDSPEYAGSVKADKQEDLARVKSLIDQYMKAENSKFRLILRLAVLLHDAHKEEGYERFDLPHPIGGANELVPEVLARLRTAKNFGPEIGWLVWYHQELTTRAGKIRGLLFHQALLDLLDSGGKKLDADLWNVFYLLTFADGSALDPAKGLSFFDHRDFPTVQVINQQMSEYFGKGRRGQSQTKAQWQESARDENRAYLDGLRTPALRRDMVHQVMSAGLLPADADELANKINNQQEFDALFDEYAGLFPLSYLQDLDSHTLAKQLVSFMLVSGSDQAKRKVQTIVSGTRTGYGVLLDMVVFKSKDEHGILYKIFGVLSAVGINILNAQVHTVRASVVDQFQGYFMHKMEAAQMWERVKRHIKVEGLPEKIDRWEDLLPVLIELVLENKIDVDMLLDQGPVTYFGQLRNESGGKTEVSFAANIEFDKNWLSVLEIEGPDRYGLLYSLARILSEKFNVNIATSPIFTRYAGIESSFLLTKADSGKQRALTDDEKKVIADYFNAFFRHKNIPLESIREAVNPKAEVNTENDIVYNLGIPFELDELHRARALVRDIVQGQRSHLKDKAGRPVTEGDSYQNFKVLNLESFVEALNTGADAAQLAKGGIDFNADKVGLQVQNDGQQIKFRMDQGLLRQLQNAPGFVPVIINIQPMPDLRLFLGIKETPAQARSGPVPA